jgi:hypothetical protein
MTSLVRYDPDTGRRQLGDMWTCRKGSRSLMCSAWTHPHGWELRVEADGEMVRTQVCRHEADVFETAQLWKSAATQNGWHA